MICAPKMMCYNRAMTDKSKKDNYFKSIAYCGLICDLCFRRNECDGCRQINNICERNCSIDGCYQKNCCSDKKINGCWECDDIYECSEGIYSAGDFSKIKAFAICIKEDGPERFIKYVLKNMETGWSVEKGRDYDGKTIKEILSMLRSGVKQ